MHTQTPNLDWLAAKPAAAVAAFAADLEAAFGSRLVCLALTGSVVSGDFVAGVSDINSVAVLDELDFAALDSLAALGKRHGKHAIHAPLVLSAASIVPSLDVFPIEFLEIKLGHRTVLGTAPFGELSIASGHLRLQLERELKARLINLRQGYLSAAGDAKLLSSLIVQAYKGFFPLFRAFLYLNGQSAPPLRRAETLSAACQVSGLAVACFDELEELTHERRPKLPAQRANQLFKNLYETTHALAIQVDRHLA